MNKKIHTSLCIMSIDNTHNIVYYITIAREQQNLVATRYAPRAGSGNEKWKVLYRKKEKEKKANDSKSI